MLKRTFSLDEKTVEALQKLSVDMFQTQNMSLAIRYLVSKEMDKVNQRKRKSSRKKT